jgi:hypothetical protein
MKIYDNFNFGFRRKLNIYIYIVYNIIYLNKNEKTATAATTTLEIYYIFLSYLKQINVSKHISREIVNIYKILFILYVYI